MALNLNSKDLNAVATGTGPDHETQGKAFVTMTTIAGAGVSAGVVVLEGSPDAVNYAVLATRTLTAAGTFADSVNSIHRHLRVRISTAITGGTATVWLTATGQAPEADVGWSG